MSSSRAASTPRGTSRPAKKARTKKEDSAETAIGVSPTDNGEDAMDGKASQGDAGSGDESDTKLYCICRSDKDSIMIACDHCDEWFHAICMNIAEDQALLVDIYICPTCAEHTMQRTTYKQKCLRAECTDAALRPLSRYCSERCGILAVGARIQKASKLPVKGISCGGSGTVAANAATKKMAEKVLQIGRVANAQRRDGIVTWENDAESKDKMGAWMAHGVGNYEQLHAELMSSGASTSATPIESADIQTVLPLLEQLSRIREQCSKVQQQRQEVDAAIDLIAARQKVLQLADDRAATLEPVATTGDDDVEEASKSKKSKSKKKASDATSAAATTEPARPRGQPRCGYDERLGWDDDTFRAWAREESARAMLDETVPLDGRVDGDESDFSPVPAVMDSDGPPANTTGQPRICGQAKRKCRRHADWTAVRGAAFEYERDLQLQLFARLGEQVQAYTTRITTLQRSVRSTLQETIARRQNADEILARRLAAEGTRRAAVV